MFKNAFVSRTVLSTLTILGLSTILMDFPLPPDSPISLKSGTANAAEPSGATPENLQATTWYIAGGSAMTPLNLVPVKLTFSEDKFSGNTGCNNFSGSYSITQDKLDINEQIATTRKACPEALGQQENQLLSILPTIQRYGFTRRGELKLIYSQGDKEESLIFIPADQLTPLHNSRWQLVSMGGKQPLPDRGNRPPSLMFVGHAVSGSGGCNRLAGKYRIKGDRLMIDDRMAATLMACPEALMAQEQEFVQALGAAQSYQLQPDELIINYDQPGTKGQLKFVALSPAKETASKGMEKIVYVGPTRADCTGVGAQKMPTD